MTVMSRVSLLTTFFFLLACKSYDVTPGAERVRVFDAEPKGCIYVGEVSSVQDDKTVGTLETEMDLSTRVDLRNKAHALGGNILVFLKGKNTNTLPGSKVQPLAAKTGSSGGKPSEAAKPAETATLIPTESLKKEKDDTDLLIFLATVFRCPSSILNQ